MADDNFYPPVSFYFKVLIGSFNTTADVRFQEVKGIEVEAGTETIEEGGVNGYKHVVPTTPKFGKAVLTRGYVTDSAIRSWIEDALLRFTFAPKQIFITLMDSTGGVKAKWTLYNAYPLKWSISPFHSTENKIAIETLELQYSYFVRNV